MQHCYVAEDCILLLELKALYYPGSWSLQLIVNFYDKIESWDAFLKMFSTNEYNNTEKPQEKM